MRIPQKNRGTEAMEANFLASFHFVSHQRCEWWKVAAFCGQEPRNPLVNAHEILDSLNVSVFFDHRSRSAQSVWAHLCWFKARSCLLPLHSPRQKKWRNMHGPTARREQKRFRLRLFDLHWLWWSFFRTSWSVLGTLTAGVTRAADALVLASAQRWCLSH